jgi:hypothetical protein
VPRLSDLLLVGALAAGAVVVALVQAVPPPPPPPPLEASLAVVDERVSSTRGGVLVVPVEVDNPGPAVQVRDVVVPAGPVRATPLSTGATAVATGDQARFVVILEPDCRLLGVGSPIVFVAAASVTLRAADGRELLAFVDVGRSPEVAQRVARTCADAMAPAAPVTTAAG